MPGIDPVFSRTRAKPTPKGRRRKMMSFKLDEISLVDKPAQEGATVKIMKRAQPLHSLSVDYDRVLTDVRRLRKRGQHQRADELQKALALHAQSSIIKTAGENVMSTLFDKARKANGASVPASASAGSFGYDMDKADEETLAELQAQFPDVDPDEMRTLLAEARKADEEGEQEEYLEPIGDEDAEKAELGADELEELEAAELEEEVIQTKAGQDMNDRSQPFDEDTEIGIEANRQMKDKRTSKQLALYKAFGRAIAARGAYAKAFAISKAEALSTTDSERPFHQGRALDRRNEMDNRARQHRSQANAEIAAMHAGANMGREMEEKRRMIDGAVTKLREVDPRMRHQDAMRKVRLQMPGLFR